jgi:hypothetical protein
MTPADVTIDRVSPGLYDGDSFKIG